MAGDWGVVAEHPALVALGELHTALDHLAEANLWSLSPAELRGLRMEMERLGARAGSATLRVTRELDTSGAAVETGAFSPAGWLRGVCRIDPRAAKREVKLAAALDGRLGATGAALGTGEISVEHAAVIREAVDRLPLAVPADVRTEGETWLVEQSRIFDPAAVARLGRHLLHALDPEHGAELESEEAEQQRRQSFSLGQRHDGSRIPKGSFTAENGALIDAALDAVSAPVPAADGTPDPRTPGQRRAQGLLELIRLALGAPAMPQDGGEPVTVVVTVPLETLEARLDAAGVVAAELDNGAPISAETARRMACDAFLVAAVLGTSSEVLDIGRLSRVVPRAMRRALVARDRGCAFPGCGRPPRWCQAHHIAHWTRDRGPTCLSNLVLLCGRHHRVIHHEGWSVRIGDDGLPVFQPPRWIDPDQIEQPSYNTTWQLALQHIPIRT
jgi:Domain of unknown function (DUF222)